VIAIQSPSGACSANIWIRPIRLLTMPATTRPMQKARKARSASPALCAKAAIATTSTAGRIVPAAYSDKDQGTVPKINADTR